MGSVTNRNPLVSVVVPVYKAEKTIEKCVDSILDQTYRNLELILVDDGSPDKSGEICDSFTSKDNRVHVIHTPNGGVSHARNTGIENAKGDYLFFVDSDDWIESEHIQRLLPIDDEDLVYGGIKFFKKGCLSREYPVPARIVQQYEWISNFREFGMGPYAIFFIIPCYRMEIIQKHGLRFDTSLGISEDGLFNLSFLKHCQKIRYEASSTYCYDNGDESSSSLSHKFHANRLQASMKESMMQESITGKPEYALRWYHWNAVFRHYRHWSKCGDRSIKKEVRKKQKESYQNTYFRECIPYIRKNGSLDQKIETYFMQWWLHPLFKITYSFVVLCSKFKKLCR